MAGGRYLGLQGTKLQVAIGFLAGMDFLLFGYDQGVTGGLLTLQSFTVLFPEIDTSSDTYEHIKKVDPASVAARPTRQGLYVHSCRLAWLTWL